MRYLLENLDKLLDQYDRVILADISDQDGKARWQRFLNSEAFKNCEKKILFLVTEIHDISRQFFLTITEEVAQELKSLYFMYEFSDRFQLFSNETTFGEIWNYVCTGTLTEEEAFQAILH